MSLASVNEPTKAHGTLHTCIWSTAPFERCDAAGRERKRLHSKGMDFIHFGHVSSLQSDEYILVGGKASAQSRKERSLGTTLTLATWLLDSHSDVATCPNARRALSQIKRRSSFNTDEDHLVQTEEGNLFKTD